MYMWQIIGFEKVSHFFQLMCTKFVPCWAECAMCYCYNSVIAYSLSLKGFYYMFYKEFLNWQCNITIFCLKGLLAANKCGESILAQTQEIFRKWLLWERFIDGRWSPAISQQSASNSTRREQQILYWVFQLHEIRVTFIVFSYILFPFIDFKPVRYFCLYFENFTYFPTKLSIMF